MLRTTYGSDAAEAGPGVPHAVGHGDWECLAGMPRLRLPLSPDESLTEMCNASSRGERARLAPLGLEEAAAELRVGGLQEAGQRGGGARGAAVEWTGGEGSLKYK